MSVLRFSHAPDVPQKLVEKITSPSGHAPHIDDIVCIVKRWLADEEVAQCVTVLPHYIRQRLPSQVPETTEPRTPSGKVGNKWRALAADFEEQNNTPFYSRASRYLRQLADGTLAVGKAPAPLPWHSRRGNDTLQHALVGDIPHELLASVPLRATWA